MRQRGGATFAPAAGVERLYEGAIGAGLGGHGQADRDRIERCRRRVIPHLAVRVRFHTDDAFWDDSFSKEAGDCF